MLDGHLDERVAAVPDVHAQVTRTGDPDLPPLTGAVSLLVH